jgi:hypothetical protein
LGTKLIKCDTECLQFFKIGISTGFQGFWVFGKLPQSGGGGEKQLWNPKLTKFLLLSYEIHKIKYQKHEMSKYIDLKNAIQGHFPLSAF